MKCELEAYAEAPKMGCRHVTERDFETSSPSSYSWA